MDDLEPITELPLPDSTPLEVPAAEDEMEVQGNDEMGNFDSYSISPAVLLQSGLPSEGVITVKGVFDGVNYTVLFPLQYLDSIFVSDEGYLINVGSSSITGRAFTGSSFNTSDYNMHILTIRSALADSANNVYQYQSLGSMKSYYESGTRLSSDSVYGEFLVDSLDYDFGGSPEYLSMLYDLVIIFLIGVLLICFLKNSRSS